MRSGKRLLTGISAFAALAASNVFAGDYYYNGNNGGNNKFESVRLRLTPSSDKLADCMPDAYLKVKVELATDALGFDRFTIKARDLPPNTPFTVFLLEQPGLPFGAAEYIGDFTTDDDGYAKSTYNLIVEEAFASTLVNGERVRVDLNQIGVWFADPKDDDFCLGPKSPVTPFDGDDEAGVQAFNSAEADPLP